jgi:hypothetical protein
MDSILTSIKNLLGITEEQKDFDNQIIIHINSVLGALTQIGVGPEEGFAIQDDSASWADFIPEEGPKLESVKTYIYAKVRLMFDPPTSSALIENLNKLASELEWRLSVTVDPTPPEYDSCGW